MDAGSDVVEELVEGLSEEEVKQEQTHEEQAALVKGVLQGNEDADGDPEGDAGTDKEFRWINFLEFVLEHALLNLLNQLQAEHCRQEHSQDQIQADTAE